MALTSDWYLGLELQSTQGSNWAHSKSPLKWTGSRQLGLGMISTEYQGFQPLFYAYVSAIPLQRT